MEIQFREKPCEFLRRIVHETAQQEETADVIVPDSFPDVARIVCCSASVIVRSKECRTGSVTLSGGIRACAVYVPEDGSQPRALDQYIPFSLRTDHPALSEQTQCVTDCFVRSADARMLNSRKVMFRVNLGCITDGYEPQSEAFYEPVETPPALQLKRQSFPLLLPAATGERSFPISETLTLPAGKPPIAQLLCWDSEAYVEDRKIVGNKAVFKGNLYVRLLYLTQDERPETAQIPVPFSQYCELESDCADQDLQLRLLHTGAQLEPEAESGRELILLVQLLAQCVVSRVETVQTVEDAFAVGQTLDADWKICRLNARLDRQTLRLPIRQSIETDAAAIVDSTIYPDFAQVSHQGSTAAIRVPLTVNLLCYDSENELQGITVRAEAVGETALAAQAQCDVRPQILPEGYAIAAGNSVELRYEADADVSTYAEQELRTLSEASLLPPEDEQPCRPSVVLFTNRERRSVWDIAKQYGADVGTVSAVNGLDGDSAEEGKILLIPM